MIYQHYQRSLGFVSYFRIGAAGPMRQLGTTSEDHQFRKEHGFALGSLFGAPRTKCLFINIISRALGSFRNLRIGAARPIRQRGATSDDHSAPTVSWRAPTQCTRS